MSEKVSSNAKSSLIQNQNGCRKSITFLDFDDVESLFAEADLAALTVGKPKKCAGGTQTSGVTLSCQSIEDSEFENDDRIKNIYCPNRFKESTSEVLIKKSSCCRVSSKDSQGYVTKVDRTRSSVTQSQSEASLGRSKSYCCNIISSNKTRQSTGEIQVCTKQCENSGKKREPIIIEKRVCSKDCDKYARTIKKNESDSSGARRNCIYCPSASVSKEKKIKEEDVIQKKKIYATKSPFRRKKSKGTIVESKSKSSCCSRSSVKKTQNDTSHIDKQVQYSNSTETTVKVVKKKSCCSGSKTSKKIVHVDKQVQYDPDDYERTLVDEQIQYIKPETSKVTVVKNRSCCSRSKETTIIKNERQSIISKDSEETFIAKRSYCSSGCKEKKKRKMTIERKKSEKSSCCSFQSRKKEPCTNITCPRNLLETTDFDQKVYEKQNPSESFGKISHSNLTIPDTVVPSTSVNPSTKSLESLDSNLSIDAKSRTCSNMDVSRITDDSNSSLESRGSDETILENKSSSMKTPRQSKQSASRLSVRKSSLNSESNVSGIRISVRESSEDDAYNDFVPPHHSSHKSSLKIDSNISGPKYSKSTVDDDEGSLGDGRSESDGSYMQPSSKISNENIKDESNISGLRYSLPKSIEDDDGSMSLISGNERSFIPTPSTISNKKLSLRKSSFKDDSNISGLRYSLPKSIEDDDGSMSLISGNERSFIPTPSTISNKKLSLRKSSFKDDSNISGLRYSLPKSIGDDADEPLGLQSENERSSIRSSGIKKLSLRKSSLKDDSNISGLRYSLRKSSVRDDADESSLGQILEEQTPRSVSSKRLSVRKSSIKGDFLDESSQRLSVEKPSTDLDLKDKISDISLEGERFSVAKPSMDERFSDTVPGYSVEEFADYTPMDVSDSRATGISGIRVSVKSNVVKGDDVEFTEEPNPQSLTCPCKCCQNSKYSNYRSLIFPYLAVELKPISVKALVASYKTRFKRNAQTVHTKIRGKIRDSVSKVKDKL
ncbi:PREDICTED: uncharacterized protein LOC108558735 [Nicrophorus vespilloides]|uniref:Uncharacterized protein LOC108558735 n=1 Tax=Nicrophorus vespilloides TaxID=110193 RepID=A0ABM1M9I6_NICVS|nr:PREDICTED: uncharacterized protein LOC108558735 [Nicrophorus vespilloides]